ncbi:MAG: hypothetical protein KY395_00870 [Actinobacteria bacterium]|nr:hypothetical protein [Actinomycetota bacterium]
MAGDWGALGLALGLGLVCGAAAWMAMRPVFGHEILSRRNFRNRELPVAGGLALVAGVVVAGSLWVLARVLVDDSGASGPEISVGLAVVGFGLLGFVDDILGSGQDRGFRGHVRGLLHGRLGAGGLKLVGGGALAVVVASVGGSSPAWLFVDAVLIALAANLFNLFDLAPGRALKISAVVFVVIAVAGGATATLRAPAVAVGAALALAWPDLRERVMLGDTGANPLGAVIGLAVVLTASPTTRLLVMVGLVVLNAASEVVSFSRIIERVALLRMFDRLGRMP